MPKSMVRKSWRISKEGKSYLVVCDSNSVDEAAKNLKLIYEKGSASNDVYILKVAGVTMKDFRKSFGDEASLDQKFPVQAEYRDDKTGYFVLLNLKPKEYKDFVFGKII
jgi:hypothetical protein